jgi:DNA-binding MarR family transcriptional regulator
MSPNPSPDQELVLAIAAAWGRIERRLDGAVSTIKGISFAEYRLLRCLADAPGGQASRVDLAEAIGLTPSGATRALRPLEKLGFVETHKSERDARLALAALTDQGRELVADASGVIDDTAAQLIARSPGVVEQRSTLIELVTELAGG